MLTDAKIKALKPQEKRYSTLDSDGLYIEVLPGGGKHWRVRKRHAGGEIKRSLGKYPAVSLREARRLRDNLLEMLERNGARETFESVATEWLETKVEPIRASRHTETIVSRLRRFVFPAIGQMPVSEVSPPELLSIAREIERTGKIETARRTVQICGQVMRYAVATGRARYDPSGALKGALAPTRVKHRATITNPREIGGLMRAIDGLKKSPIVRAALLIQAYTFVRPGELRRARWGEISKEDWKIPAEKMKMRRPHIVPLSSQAQKVLKDLEPLTGGSEWVFPAARDKTRPMSDMTVNAALRRLGYGKDEITGHGFRSMASTILNENGWPADVIERQLAHVEKNAVRAAYNHAEYLPKRREMMQWWADWLNGQK